MIGNTYGKIYMVPTGFSKSLASRYAIRRSPQQSSDAWLMLVQSPSKFCPSLSKSSLTDGYL